MKTMFGADVLATAAFNVIPVKNKNKNKSCRPRKVAQPVQWQMTGRLRPVLEHKIADEFMTLTSIPFSVIGPRLIRR
jgi:hypothetical protein